MRKKVEEGVYVISVAARLAEMHPQTLRLYERKGLLRPARTSKNRRRYSDADIERLRRIQELTQREGLNLEGVRKVLEMEEEIGALKREVADLKLELERVSENMREEIERIRRSVALVRAPARSIVLKRR